jgi:hypothetical protein
LDNIGIGNRIRAGRVKGVREVKRICLILIIVMVAWASSTPLLAATSIEERVKDTLSRLTLEEKAGQMVQGELGYIGLTPHFGRISA